MANDSIVPNIGVLLCQGRQQLIQGVVLGISVRLIITAFEFDTNAEVIALLAPLPAGDARVPSPHIGGDKLHHLTCAPNQKVS